HGQSAPEAPALHTEALEELDAPEQEPYWRNFFEKVELVSSFDPWKLQIGPSAAGAASTSPTAPKAKGGPAASGANALQQTIAGLRAAGIKKVFIAEQHKQSRNLDTIISVLLGAKEGGPVSYYREVEPGQPDGFDRRIQDPSLRKEVIGVLISHTGLDESSP